MFLLVPAHPCCPGQNPKSCKMVVCVCVFVCVPGFTFLVLAHPGSSGHSPGGRKTVVVVVVVVNSGSWYPCLPIWIYH